MTVTGDTRSSRETPRPGRDLVGIWPRSAGRAGFYTRPGDSPTWRIAQMGYDCERDANNRASEWARQHAQSGESKRESKRASEIASERIRLQAR